MMLNQTATLKKLKALNVVAEAKMNFGVKGE
jgi:hypothetical protein